MKGEIYQVKKGPSTPLLTNPPPSKKKNLSIIREDCVMLFH